MMDLLQFTCDPLLQAVPLDWQQHVGPFYDEKDALKLSQAIQYRYECGETIYPSRDRLFRALELTSYREVKCVLIGQDPYHEPGQAMGVAFAVPNGTKLPPSLKNIFKEYSEDLAVSTPKDSTLVSWAQNGVLLLNTVLSVKEHTAASHRHLGWEELTIAIIRAVSSKKSPVAFILWGSDAIKLKKYIDISFHIVVESVHPSPLSAYRGFFGSRPFSTVNRLLSEHGVSPINWKL